MSDSQPSPPEGSPNARHRVWGPQFLRRTRSILENAGAGAQELGRRLEQGRALREQAGGGFCLMDQREHWDLAVVLDACRYDVFARVNRLPGRLEKRISPGSSTEEWVEVNCDGDFQDVVYVSASPYVSRLYLEQLGLSVPFAHLEETWKKGWDENLHTVPPQAVMEAYRRVKTAWPMKRFVLHFMQPHYPFIGATRIGAEGWRKYWARSRPSRPSCKGPPSMSCLKMVAWIPTRSARPTRTTSGWCWGTWKRCWPSGRGEWSSPPTMANASASAASSGIRRACPCRN